MSMKAIFIKSSVRVEDCPPPDKPEYAFVGRSNVGKSSLINMLVGRKNLAATSSQPGKTRTINHFLVEDRWYLADLPGYGYARVSQQQREQWQHMIASYLSQRPNLLYTFVLLDLRLKPQNIDLRVVERLGQANIPLAIIFTKADKLSKHQRKTHLDHYHTSLSHIWEELPPCFVSSAVDGMGRAELLQFIDSSNAYFRYEPNTFRQIVGSAPQAKPSTILPKK